MKYILSRILIKAASEKKKEFIKNKYELSDEEIQLLEEADPTPQGKYLEWLANMYKKGSLRLPEDSFVVKPALERFHKIKDKRVFTDEKDINKYSSPGSLYRVLEKYEEGLEEESKDLLKRKEQAKGGYREIVKGPGYVWFEVTTPEAACALGSGTSWCTVQDYYSSQYLNEGPLYILYINGKPELQVHFDSNQLMDIYDDPIGEFVPILNDLPEILVLYDSGEKYREQLKDLISKLNIKAVISDSGEDFNRVLSLALEKIEDSLKKGHKKDYNEAITAINKILHLLNMLDQSTKDFLQKIGKIMSKIIPKVSRHPDKEQILEFIDYLGNYYSLHGDNIRIPELEKALLDLDFIKDIGTVDHLFHYKEVRGGDWPELEKFILKALPKLINLLDEKDNSMLSFTNPIVRVIASIIINSGKHYPHLLPKIEKFIKDLPGFAYYYALNILENRWPEAEKYIMKDPLVAYYYALKFMPGGWPEAEKYIKTSPYVAFPYALNVKKGRFPEAEEYILKDPDLSIEYALKVLKSRWPEAEKNLDRLDNVSLYFRYKDEFLKEKS